MSAITADDGDCIASIAWESSFAFETIWSTAAMPP